MKMTTRRPRPVGDVDDQGSPHRSRAGEDELPLGRPSGAFRAVGGAVRILDGLNRFGRRPPVLAVDRDLRLVVREVHAEAKDVVSLWLTRPGGSGQLPTWHPGAHLDVVTPSGTLRQYSLCGDPADRFGYRIAVRRIADGLGGSREMHELRPGAELVVRGPRSAFPLIRAPRYLFVAGGIGITPILPMLRAVAATGAEWRFVYAGRDRDSMPFLGEISRLDQSRVTIRTDVEHGGPPTGAELLGHAPEGATGYLCGPPPMVTALRAAMDSAVDRADPRLVALHTERFSAPPVVGGRPFVVELARSRRRLAVPSDRSVLDVVTEALPTVAYSCRQGFCGTCRTSVLSGEVEHHDRALTEAERNGEMAICVSRAKGDQLVLDL